GRRCAFAAQHVLLHHAVRLSWTIVVCTLSTSDGAALRWGDDPVQARAYRHGARSCTRHAVMTTFRPPRRDHFTSTRRACAALCASVVSGCAAPPASDLGCDRACLVGVTQRYFEALGLRAPQRAGLASGARISENGAQVDSSGSVFGSARPVRWHQVFADPQTGQVAAFARYDDAQGPVLYAARLKVRQRQITEVEALVNRRGAHPFFAP